MRAIWKVISSGLLTKQAMGEKKFIIYKNIYVPKLLLSVVTTGTEALVISGNMFTYACVKEVCRP
jgi:hypothetical protein